MDTPEFFVAALLALYYYPRKLLSGPEAFGVGVAYSLGANFVLVDGFLDAIEAYELIGSLGKEICYSLLFIVFSLPVFLGGYSAASTYEDGRVQSLVFLSGVTLLISGFVCMGISTQVSNSLAWVCYLSIPIVIFLGGYSRGFKVEAPLVQG